MLVFALLLAQAAAPTATPAPDPTSRPAALLGRTSAPARPKSLSEHAAEMKAKGTPARPVSFEDVRTVEEVDAAEPEETVRKPGARGGTRSSEEKAGTNDGTGAAKAAQKRMDRAVERGLAVPERTRSASRDKARREWDAAAEACRATPGCAPVYRDDVRWGDDKPLKTDAELIDEIRKRGFSEPHPVRK